MGKKRWTYLVGLLVLASMILGACAPTQDPQVAELEAALASGIDPAPIRAEEVDH